MSMPKRYVLKTMSWRERERERNKNAGKNGNAEAGYVGRGRGVIGVFSAGFGNLFEMSRAAAASHLISVHPISLDFLLFSFSFLLDHFTLSTL